jgi:hypothetical protein
MKVSPKIRKLVNQIKALPASDLKALLEELKDLLPPLQDSGVPAMPKDNPPALSASAKQEVSHV